MVIQPASGRDDDVNGEARVRALDEVELAGLERREMDEVAPARRERAREQDGVAVGSQDVDGEVFLDAGGVDDVEPVGAGRDRDLALFGPVGRRWRVRTGSCSA
jgi:hypothetical protein